MYVNYLDRVKRIWYLSPMRAAKVQASLRIRAVSPEPPLLAHTSSVSRGTFRQKARFLAPLNCWACAVKVCHDGMLEDTNSLGGAHLIMTRRSLRMLGKINVLKFIDSPFLRNGQLGKFISNQSTLDVPVNSGKPEVHFKLSER